MRGRPGAGSATSRRPGRARRPGREDPALVDPALGDPHVGGPALGGRRTRGPAGADGGADDPGPAELDPDHAYRVAREIALRKLETRDRTRAELADALRERATPEPVIDAVLTRLTEVGLVDDVRFARSWVESRQRTRSLAGRALTAELRRRGVDDDTVASAVDTIDPAGEEQRALQLARERVARSPGLSAQVLTRRIVGQLARRGYDSAVCFRAVRAALGEAARPVPDDPDVVSDDMVPERRGQTGDQLTR